MTRLLSIVTVVVGLVLAMIAAGGQPVKAGEPLVVVPNRVIYPGQEISATALDLVPLRRELPDPDAIVFAREEIVGKVASRTLLPGRLINRGSMRDAYLVQQGAPVQVVYTQGAMTISATGVPLQSGSAGDLIKVRNIDSGAVFTGIVMADGTIRVGST